MTQRKTLPTRSTLKTLRAIALLCSACLVIVACGVPADDKPRAIPPNQVPFDLLAPSTVLPSSTSPAPTAPATLYFVRDAKLVRVQRNVVAPPSLGPVLASLMQGANDAEMSNGIRTTLTSQSRVTSAGMQDDTAVVGFNDAFLNGPRQDVISAIAQVVFTATELPGVNSVRITINAQNVSVPRGDGSTTLDVLRRSDYSTFAPAG